MKTIGKSRGPVLASSFDFGGKFSGSKMFDDSGELNAASKKDALSMIGAITAAIQQRGGSLQDLETESGLEDHARKRAARQNPMEALQAALAEGPNGDTANELNAELATSIYINAVKQGFMRQFLVREDVEQGDLPRINVDRREVYAAILQGPTQAQMQIVRDQWVIVPEVDVTFRIMIEGKRLNQSKEDLLQSRFNHALESVLIQEDRLWKLGSDKIIDQMGSMGSTAIGAITPTILTTGITNLTGNGMNVANIIFAAPIFGSIIYDVPFGVVIDPVTRLEILKTGNIGNMFGAKIWTDAVRDPRQKVLASNEIYLMADPRYVGAYTDRGGVQSKPLSSAETGINGLGWSGVEYLGMLILGERGIARIRLS